MQQDSSNWHAGLTRWTRSSHNDSCLIPCSPRPEVRNRMSRISLAITALVMFAGGIATWQVEGGETAGPVLVRVGMVLGVFWLAMPQLEGIFKGIGSQYALLIGIAGLVMVLSPRGIKVIIPVVVLAALALGGLQIASRMFGAGSSRRE